MSASFRPSDIGLLPEDWRIAQLGSALRRPPAYGIGAAAVAFDPQLPTYLRITDITDDGRFSEAARVSVAHPAAKDYLLEPGDVVVARTGASVGKSYLYQASDGELVFAGFLIRLSTDPNRLAPAFLAQFLHSRPYWNWVRANSMRSGQPGINGREYATLPVPCPPLREQVAIVSVLGDMDAGIETLEQLVAKKRQIKEGAMRELLLGRRRLPGFNGSWELRRLDDLGRWTGGNTPSMQNPDYWEPELLPWVASGDVKSARLSSTALSISEFGVSRGGATVIPAGSILLVARSGILRRHLPVALNLIPMAINQDIKALLPNKEVLAEFLMQSITFHGDHILARCLKSGTTVESIEYQWLKEFSIPVPPLDEQTAIVAILSEMDSDIDVLREMLVKTRQIKQGLVQELLTGKTRLV